MSKKSKSTPPQTCHHCGNTAPLTIVAEHSQIHEQGDDVLGLVWNAGNIYELLECPACRNVSLRRYYWHEDVPEGTSFEVLYPSSDRSPVGLPAKIERAYEAALRVRRVDANAYGVLIGRVLEMVVEDRIAKGKNLYARLNDLADRGEIPAKLARAANSLRRFRNIGAHASLGELTSAELPIVDDLCRALLQYVYSAPYWVSQAEQRLSKRTAQPRHKRRTT